MKKILLPLLFCLPVIVFAAAPEQSGEPGNSDESTKISLYVPGFMVKMSSWFVKKEKDPELKMALKKIRSTSIVVREGDAYDRYNASGKYERKMKKMEHRNFDELLTAVDDGQQVSFQVRQNKNEKIRQLVVIVNDGEASFVFLRLRCNISPVDLKSWLSKKGRVKEKLGDIINI